MLSNKGFVWTRSKCRKLSKITLSISIEPLFEDIKHVFPICVLLSLFISECFSTTSLFVLFLSSILFSRLFSCETTKRLTSAAFSVINAIYVTKVPNRILLKHRACKIPTSSVLCNNALLVTYMPFITICYRDHNTNIH